MMNKTIIFITHDFDEALRLADRIAIMKDGRVEQCDTPDQIVLNPATDYVAKFTAEIDRARVVHIGSLATPLTAPALGEPVAAHRTIRDLARLLISDPRSEIPVVNGSAAVIGAVSRQKALDVLLGEAR